MPMTRQIMKRIAMAAAVAVSLPLAATAADTDVGRIAMYPELVAATNDLAQSIGGGGSAPTGFVAYTNLLARPSNGSAAYVTIQNGQTLVCDSSTWPDGASMFAVVRPLGVYDVGSTIGLAGYSPWPTNAFQMVAWRVGGRVCCNIISEFAAAPTVTYGEDGAAAARSPVGWTYLTGGTVAYQTNGNSVDLTLASGGTLSVSSTGWIDGQSMLVAVHPAGTYSVSASLSLVGYASWPESDFYAVVWRVGNQFYANIIGD